MQEDCARTMVATLGIPESRRYDISFARKLVKEVLRLERQKEVGRSNELRARLLKAVIEADDEDRRVTLVEFCAGLDGDVEEVLVTRAAWFVHDFLTAAAQC